MGVTEDSSSLNKLRKRVKVPEIDISKVENKNPFVDSDFEIYVSKLYKKGVFKKVEGKIKPVDYELESEAYSKLFKAAKYRLGISSCSVGAKSLFIWIQYELDVAKDYLWINRVRYMEENGISSENTFLAACNELIERKVIYPIKDYKDVFFINPRIIFCGSRLNKYPDNVVIK